MTSAEFIRRARRYARKHRLQFDVIRSRGKGSHAYLVLAGRRTVFPMHAGRELKAGTISTALKNLGLKREDLD